MKYLIFMLSCILVQTATAQECRPQLKLSEHMRELSHIADQVFSGYDKVDREGEVLENIRLMREHLAAALVLTPLKIQQLPVVALEREKLDYQQTISKMISLSLTLERAFRLKPLAEDQKAVRLRAITDTLMAMSQTIGSGHERFRNRP